VDAVTKITQAMNLNSADDCIWSISVSVQLLNYVKIWNCMPPRWYSYDGPGPGTYSSGQHLGFDASLFHLLCYALYDCWYCHLSVGHYPSSESLMTVL